MLPVYVFTAGATTREVFNAVSAFMNTDSFSRAMSIGVMFSILGCAIQYIKTHDLMGLLKWFAIYFCVSFLLVGVKTSVQIFDLSDPMNIYAVDNVPYGIAMPASIITSLEAGLTQGIEDVFHTPDDVTYATTGMLFGAQLFNAVNNGSTILDDGTRNDLNHFVQQCIIPDILINHKYTFEDLQNSPDVLTFLSQQPMSPLRGIYINGTFDTCTTALPILSQEIENNVGNQRSWIATSLFGDKTISGGELFSKIQNVYSYMMDMTDDASHILYQNTMINAIRSGIGTQIAKNDSAAAMMNYGYTSAMQKQLLADNTLARVATYVLPLTQTVFMLVLISVFPIIVLLSLQPFLFFRMIKNYLGGLIYLATWPLLFSIINFIMTTELSFHLTGMEIAHGGITLSNQNQMLYVSEQFAAYCGYLMPLILVLAAFIFKGLDTVIMSAAQSVMANMQGWASQTATALADGNVSLANSSVGNHSWNNWSANKHDTNNTNFSGMQTNQLDNGATVTHTPTGNDIYNTGSAISQLATGIHVGAMISSQISQSIDHSQQLAKQQSENFTHSLNQSWNDLSSFSNANGVTENKGHNYSISEQSSTTQVVSNIMGIAHDVAERNHMSEQQAYQHLTGGNFGLTISGHTGIPKLAPVNGNLGASGGLTRSHSNSYGTSHDESSSINISSNEQKQFNENYSFLQNAASTSHFDQSQNHNLSGLAQISTDLRKSDSIAHQLSSTLTDSERYSEMKSYAESNSGDIKNNGAQEFVKYVEKNYPTEASSILRNTDNVEIAEKRQALAESFVKNTYMNQFEKSFNASKSSLNKEYESSSGAIANKTDRVFTNFMEQKNNIISHENQKGLHQGNLTSDIKDQVNSRIAGTHSNIDEKSRSIQKSNHDLSNNANQKMQQGKEHLKEGNSYWQDTPF